MKIVSYLKVNTIPIIKDIFKNHISNNYKYKNYLNLNRQIFIPWKICNSLTGKTNCKKYQIRYHMHENIR